MTLTYDMVSKHAVPGRNEDDSSILFGYRVLIGAIEILRRYLMNWKVVIYRMLPGQSRTFQPSNPFPEDRHKPRTGKWESFLRFIYVLLTLGFGVSLLVLPWSSLWDSNYFLYLYPKVRPIVGNPFFKGAVLGLGIANILIGVYEIDYFRGFSKGRLFR